MLHTVQRVSRALNLALAKHHQLLRRAPVDLACFIKALVEDDEGRHLDIAPMHEAWIRHVRFCWGRHLHSIILAHFGSGKSSTLAVPLVAWLLGSNPNLRVKIITNDDASATRRVMGVARLIESSTYQRIFPHVVRGSKWTDHEFYLTRTGHALDPSVHARGFSGTGIGGRADILVFDDVVDQKNSTDVSQRRKVTNLVEQTWLSRLEPDGNVLWIATPWHLDDATHTLMKRPGWCTLIQKVSYDCCEIDQEVLSAGTLEGYPVK